MMKMEFYSRRNRFLIAVVITIGKVKGTVVIRERPEALDRTPRASSFFESSGKTYETQVNNYRRNYYESHILLDDNRVLTQQEFIVDKRMLLSPARWSKNRKNPVLHVPFRRLTNLGIIYSLRNPNDGIINCGMYCKRCKLFQVGWASGQIDLINPLRRYGMDGLLLKLRPIPFKARSIGIPPSLNFTLASLYELDVSEKGGDVAVRNK